MTTRLPRRPVLVPRGHNQKGRARVDRMPVGVIDRDDDNLRANVEKGLSRINTFRYLPPGGDFGDVLQKTDARDYNARWVPMFGTFNVKAFGAVGDDDTDDTAAIQSAIDALVEAGGGVLYFPAGVYKITAGLNIDGQLADEPAEFGITILGDNRRISRLKSYLSSADDMLFIGNASGQPQNGITIRDLGFDAAVDEDEETTSSEASLLRIDYGLDARLENLLFLNGANKQLWLGRPQNPLVVGCEFRGDEAITDVCAYLTSAPSGNGQGALFLRCTVRGARGSNGIGIWATQDGGGEHNFVDCMIEGNKRGIRLQSLRHNVVECSFENGNDSDFVAQIEVGATGVRGQHHNILNCTMSASGVANRKCIDAICYGDLRIAFTRIINDNGTHVYFGSDENNVPSYITDCEIPIASISLGGSEGKVVGQRLSANGTNYPRATASAGDTTPSVFSLEILATNNSGATTITDFDDGRPGQVLMIMVEDANTTIANNANIVTLTGANLTPASGTKYVFMGSVASGSTAGIVWIQIK